MKKAQQIISELDSLDRTKVDYNKIYQLIRSLGNISVFEITIPKGAQLIRSRSELYSDPFYYEKDITIRTDIDNISPGRCHWYTRPVFYGVIPFQDEHQAQMLSTWESSKIIGRPGVDEIQQEYATLGGWRVTEDLKAAAIVANKTFRDKNAGINHYYKSYKGFLQKLDDAERFDLIAEYFADQFGRRSSETELYHYAITSIFSDFHFAFGLDAILFPSAATGGDGEGINIAIQASAVKKLKLEHVIMRSVYYSYSKKKTFIDQFMKLSRFESDGKFAWEPLETIGRNRIEEYFSKP